MTETFIPQKVSALELLRETFIDRLSRKLFFVLMKDFKRGRLALIEKNQQHQFGQSSNGVSLQATINVHHPRFYTSTVFGGSIGSAEAYMSGFWSTSHLTNVIRLVILNWQIMEKMDKGWSWLSEPVHKLYHYFRRNTLKGSKENIVAHYDLGNDFYRLFLDETLTYSCGIFEHENTTLEAASIAKYDRICRKLQLHPEDHVIEIGGGWGGFSIHAAKNYGCRVTTTTISDEQYALAEKRIAASGLSHRIRLLRKDYRHLGGKFDKLVSIEMIEAVGHQYLNTFFQICSRLLKANGMMLLQAITIVDHMFDAHKRSVDFSKRYIFPGSCIPSIRAIMSSIARKTDLKLFHLEDITPHYVRTLAEWRKRFFDRIDDVRKMGFSDAFIRMWEYYLCYCEGGFAERYIGDVQMLLTKPMCRREPLLPPLA
ncbi:MAG: cyclopropane-fatty-acyl-phospholipid synthase family protein [Desulfobacteraceae bacterium]|nr:cyclopropane-fatty-acyl-phospholipid synthase family protein [Desulfobacteraceae bacterium]MDH3875418.1 cyclopropane-fatty-acyl-phospholipid synthase family protein [Desulfobacteraceae bacterium]